MESPFSALLLPEPMFTLLLSSLLNEVIPAQKLQQVLENKKQKQKQVVCFLFYFVKLRNSVMILLRALAVLFCLNKIMMSLMVCLGY